MKKMSKAHEPVTGKPVGKRLFCRFRCKWENYIEINFKEMRCEDVKWSTCLRTGVSGGLLLIRQ
jgi:hypothetical protein